ncbi:hypothetical protein ACPS01_22990 [Priestia aryabhattai]
MTRLYLHPLKKQGPGTSDINIRNGILNTYGFHRHSTHCLRRFILVVELSPEFPHRSLAADRPIFSFFKPLRLSFPTALW